MNKNRRRWKLSSNTPATMSNIGTENQTAPVFLSMWDMRINTRAIPRTILKWCRLAHVKRVNLHAF